MNALENIDDMLSGMWVGEENDFSEETIRAAISEVSAACDAASTPYGICNPLHKASNANAKGTSAFKAVVKDVQGKVKAITASDPKDVSRAKKFSAESKVVSYATTKKIADAVASLPKLEATLEVQSLGAFAAWKTDVWKP